MALQPAEASAKYPVDLTHRAEWSVIAQRLAPLACAICHLTDEDYKPAVDDAGISVRRAALKYTEGQLTAESERSGWRFNHPGLKPNGSIFVHALVSDGTPGTRHVHILASQNALKNLP